MPANLFPHGRRAAPSAEAVHGAARRPGAPYAAGLVLAALAIVLLPLSLAALAGALAGGLAWRLASLPWASLGGSGLVLEALAALALLLPLAFLLRPLVAGPPEAAPALDLDPAAEPRLHTFVAQISEALGAPRPVRIRASMDVNASARFAAGAASVLAGRLELTVGLPLVRGLDLAQFAGVLAHELGHFRQGGGMRLVHLLRAVTYLFSRAAAHEAAWERRVPDAGLAGSLLLPFHAAARGCAAAVRLIFRAHIRVGQAASCLLLRQMERHADTEAIRMVGGETFAGMVLEAKVLESAWGLAHRSLGLALREGRLADDLPSLVAAHTRVFIPEVRRKLEQGLLLERTALFDTHPSVAERVAFARGAGGRGLFHAAGPAHALFADFPAVSRTATREFYRLDLGEAFRPDRMVGTADLVTGHSESQVGEAAIAGYFAGLTSPLRPLYLDDGHLSAVREGSARERLALARERVEAAAGRASVSLRAYAAADARRLDAAQALALTRARFLIEPGDFQLARQGEAHAVAALAAAEDEIAAIGAALASFDSAVRDRLAAALVLLEGPETKRSMSDAPVQAREASRLVPVLGVLGRSQPYLDSLRIGFHCLGILLENIDGNEGQRELEREMRSLAAGLRRDLAAIRPLLEGTEHPFSPSGSGHSVADYAMDALPHEGDIGGLYKAAEEALERCHALHGRIMGRLALAAGRAEGALEFGPLQVELWGEEEGEDEGNGQPKGAD